MSNRPKHAARTVTDGILTILLAGLVAVMLGALVLLAVLPAIAHAETCPNAEYRSGPSAHLPDCRAYELVTPPEKNSGEVFYTGLGADEETLTFTSLSGFAGTESAEGLPGNAYVAARGAGGWGTSSVTPSSTRFLDLEADEISTAKGPVQDQSANQRNTLWILQELGQPRNSAGFYLTGPGGSIAEIGPALPPSAASVIHGTREAHALVEVHGLSADASRVVFSLVEEKGEAGSWVFASPGVGGPGALLEYVGAGNSVPLPLGVEDDGSPVDGCSSQILGGRLRRQAEDHVAAVWTHNAMSLDGKTVFLTDTCHFGIYARVDNGEAGAHTVAISEPSKGDCSACETFEGEPALRSPAYFVGASSDGSKVFFTTRQPLFDGGVSEENIYEYNFGAPAGERVTRVSGGDGTVSSPVASVQGVMQVSEDGSHVYFVATGVLTENPNGEGKKASAGASNLYVFDTESKTTVFIGTLSSNDDELWDGHSTNPAPEASEVTPDGRFLVFTSHARLTLGDTSTAAQIFEYDAQTGVLTRVSVGEEGYNNNGNTYLATTFPASEDDSLADPSDATLPEGVANYAGIYSASAYVRHLSVSSDGAYVFFQSTDGLTPQALNHVQIFPASVRQREERYGPIYAENVYEYHEGNVYLISDGRDVASGLEGPIVSLLAADPSGRDVFFTTVDQLVPEDTDTNLDIYDARANSCINGEGEARIVTTGAACGQGEELKLAGFPAPPAPAECEGNTCGGSAAAAPALLSPGSEFQLGGNPPFAVPTPARISQTKAKSKAKSKKCKKGTTLKHGRCIRTKAKKSAKGRK